MTVAPTNVHYEIDPGVFKLFLDPYMKYSSALYEYEGQPLADAQINKLQYICRQLQLEPGQRLLDIGCGWGSMSLFAAANHGVNVTAMSPARNQHVYIGERADELGVRDQVHSVIGMFPQDIQLEPASYDAAAMVTCIEHMPDLAPVFTAHWNALKPGARLYVSVGCYRTRAIYDRLNWTEGTNYARDVFGAGDMRTFTDIIAPAEDLGFGIVSVDDLTEHYRRTIEEWISNVKKEAGKIDAHEAGLSDRLVHYMTVANAGWHYTARYYAITFDKRG
jgi:cyclopropane-fatty-acyl-phospholipid synthase